MNIKPLGKRVLVEVIKTENKTKSGLILSDDKFEISENYAKVLEVGSDVLDINKNDKILFDSTKSMEVKFQGEVYFIVNLEDIYAIVGDTNE